jgi:hypothetical protein
VSNMNTALKKLEKSLDHIPKLTVHWRTFHKQLFSCLKERVHYQTSQNCRGWWRQIVNQVLTDHGPPSIVPSSLSSEQTSRGWWRPIVNQVLSDHGPPPIVPNSLSSQQTSRGWWRPIVNQVLTDHGPPPIVPNSLSSAEANVPSIAVGASAVILPAHPTPCDNPSETSNEPRRQNKRTAQHFLSDPVDYNHCRAHLQEDYAILIAWSEFEPNVRADPSNLAGDDGIVGRVVSAIPCSCAGRNIILHSVSWIIWGKICSLYCAVAFLVLAIGCL